MLLLQNVLSFVPAFSSATRRIRQGTTLSVTNALIGTEEIVSQQEETGTTVVLPQDAFRDTQRGEVSTVSCNLLAPFYNSLAIGDFEKREPFAENDRVSRIPLAFDMAKRCNGDILLLQEVEGGSKHEPHLQELLAQPASNGCEGYDSFLWAPLLPNRPDHIVGVCIAWRSKRHKMTESNCFKRGMICQFTETDDDEDAVSGGTFAVANVHLPARPSNVLGRLVTMSRTIQKLALYDAASRKSALDGMLLVGGDFNCDQNSVTAKLLTNGKAYYGNVRDRNYKANISKASAGRMKHGYRFQDIYDAEENFRKDFAPVTVSLHGRGPGCMDHLFYAQQSEAPQRGHQIEQKVFKLVNHSKGTGKSQSKRQARREKATRMRRTTKTGLPTKVGPTAMRIASILATIAGPSDTKRLEIVNQGLPNVGAGFPSDHLPVGALFTPNPEFSRSSSKRTTVLSPGNIEIQKESGGRRTKTSGSEAMSIRRRHNLVLRYLAEWLEEHGATQVIRDQPLYKNPWTKDVTSLKKKSRAPDIVCCVGNCLIVIEVTVVAASKTDAIRRQKVEKYSDLPELLSTSSLVQEAGLSVLKPHVILFGDDGRMPDDTRSDISSLASLLYDASDTEEGPDAERFSNWLQAMLSEVL